MGLTLELLCAVLLQYNGILKDSWLFLVMLSPTCFDGTKIISECEVAIKSFQASALPLIEMHMLDCNHISLLCL
jgi:hypothetical protein